MTSTAPARLPEKRQANKAEAAEWFGVSIPTIDAWLRRGAPYVQRGEKGTPWVLDLLSFAEWRFAGATDTGDDPEKLSPKDRLDWYRGTREKTRHMQEINELVTVAEYETALSGALKLVAMTLESLPDLLERDAQLPGPAVARTIEIIDAVREKIYKGLTRE